MKPRPLFEIEQTTPCCGCFHRLGWDMAASFPARPVNYKAIECFAAIREWLLPLLISLISRDQIEPVLDLIETRSQMSKNKPRQSDVMNKDRRPPDIVPQK